MRKFIDIVTEAPIADITLTGTSGYDPIPFNQGRGFGKVDKALISSPKGQAKIIRAFERTPHVFKIIFMSSKMIDGDSVGHNNDVQDVITSVGAGIHREYQDVVGEPGIIKVVMLANLSPTGAPAAPKMPMSAWTLAHKIGHSFQDHCYHEGWRSPVSDLVMKINKCIHAAFYHDRVHNDPDYEYASFGAHAITPMLTMKSARNKTMTNPFEQFPEIIAQYLIRGEAVLDIPAEASARRSQPSDPRPVRCRRGEDFSRSIGSENLATRLPRGRSIRTPILARATLEIREGIIHFRVAPCAPFTATWPQTL